MSEITKWQNKEFTKIVCNLQYLKLSSIIRPDFFLLVDLQDFFFRFRVGETKKEALKMTSWLVISELFFNISRKKVKLKSKVNQQSVLKNKKK